jgi:hypothetical protein
MNFIKFFGNWLKSEGTKEAQNRHKLCTKTAQRHKTNTNVSWGKRQKFGANFCTKLHKRAQNLHKICIKHAKNKHKTQKGHKASTKKHISLE